MTEMLHYYKCIYCKICAISSINKSETKGKSKCLSNHYSKLLQI